MQRQALTVNTQLPLSHSSSQELTDRHRHPDEPSSLQLLPYTRHEIPEQHTDDHREEDPEGEEAVEEGELLICWGWWGGFEGLAFELGGFDVGGRSNSGL